MKKGLLLVLAVFCFNHGYTQSDSLTNYFRKKDILLELGVLPVFAINAKVGFTIAPNTLIGIELASQLLLTERTEIGVFGRKYLLQNKFNVYLQGGVSYGHYSPLNLRMDPPRTKIEDRKYEPFNAIKLTGGGGVSYRVTNRFSIGNEALLGFTNHRNNYFPTLLFTANYRWAVKK